MHVKMPVLRNAAMASFCQRTEKGTCSDVDRRSAVGKIV